MMPSVNPIKSPGDPAVSAGGAGVI